MLTRPNRELSLALGGCEFLLFLLTSKNRLYSQGQKHIDLWFSSSRGEVVLDSDFKLPELKGTCWWAEGERFT
jgi:hypothetical protein